MSDEKPPLPPQTPPSLSSRSENTIRTKDTEWPPVHTPRNLPKSKEEEEYEKKEEFFKDLGDGSSEE